MANNFYRLQTKDLTVIAASKEDAIVELVAAITGENDSYMGSFSIVPGVVVAQRAPRKKKEAA